MGNMLKDGSSTGHFAFLLVPPYVQRDETFDFYSGYTVTVGALVRAADMSEMEESL